MRSLVDGLWSPRVSCGKTSGEPPSFLGQKKPGAAFATPGLRRIVSLFRRLPAERDFDAAAEIKRQRGKSCRRIVMLAGQVLDCRVDLKVAIEPITATHIDFLISRCQIAIRKEHVSAEKGVEEKGAAVAAANEVAAHCQ